MRRSIIDLGTNTCNLLIADTQGKNYQICYQGKEGVKLGKDGIHKNRLTGEAFKRAATALKKHLETIQRFEAEAPVTIATSAVRDASNKDDFSAFLLQETGLRLKVISGEEEAAYIFSGVKMAFGIIPDNSLILDIGGGSNEFILPVHNEIGWKKSFPLGMARVISRFPVSDPVTDAEIAAMEAWFEEGLTDLWHSLNGDKPQLLIGCSGAFDTLADLLDETPAGSRFRITRAVSQAEFDRVFLTVIRSTLARREKMTGMDSLRLEMIVPSFIFINLILRKLKIPAIIQTGFSLREGVLYELINR
ncbi:MAG: hypothetical protein AAGU19_04900 [Prolixibacteraceae bacterium]